MRYANFEEWDKGFPEIPDDIKQVLETFDRIRNNPKTYDPSTLQALMDKSLHFGNWLLYDYMKKIYEQNTEKEQKE